jgi:RHS repeat-associated protein
MRFGLLSNPSLTSQSKTAFAAIVLGIIGLFAGRSAGQTYSLTDLGETIGTNSYAQGINNQGQVVGYWDATNGGHAFLYQAGSVLDLGLLGLGATNNNYALSINNAGQVVGFSETTNGARAFLYKNGAVTNLGSLGGAGSYAFGINQNGQIVGYVDTPEGARAILYDGGNTINIGTLGGSNSFAFGINNSLQVAGTSLLVDNAVTHAFLWQDKVISDLNEIQVDANGWELSDAHGINDYGNIVGWGLVNNQEHAFLFSNGGVVIDLGVLTGGTNSYALGLNNSNQVVGASSTASGNHAVVWLDGNISDLNDSLNVSGWELREACGINDLGQIVGWGTINGQRRAFLLTPNNSTASKKSASLATAAVVSSAVSTTVSKSTNLVVTVRHAPCLNGGTIEGSLQQLNGEGVTANGGFAMTGDLLVPGTPTLVLNGKPTYDGTLVGSGSAAPSGYRVTLNGNCSLRYLRTRTTPVSLPTIAAPSSPKGTRSVNINSAGQSYGDATTLRDLTLNGNVGMIAVPPGTYGTFTVNGGSGLVLGVTNGVQAVSYNLQNLNLNGCSTLKIVGPVVLTLAHGFTANGMVGASNNPAWLQLQVACGGFTLNGGCTVYGLVLAPNGTVIVNGNSTLVGTSASDQFILNGCGLVRWGGTSASTNQPPVIVTQPVSQTVCAGTSAGFCVSATGSALNYQWRFNGANICGAKGSCYTVTNATPCQAGNYSVVVCNSCGMVTSSNAVLTVSVPPAITSQPISQTVCAGTSAGFYVSAAGCALNYQWRFNGTNICGAKGSCYTVTNATPSQAGNYSVVVSNSCGMVTSSNAVLTVSMPPAITIQPASLTVCVGTSAGFCVSATGCALNYQWRFNGTNICGAKGSCYTVTNATPGQAGNYSVVVSNCCGMATSGNAVLTVSVPPMISCQPISQTVCVGTSAGFCVRATGCALNYQWRFNGTNICGAKGSCYTVTNATPGQAGNYSAVVSNSCGMVSSTNAVLTVSVPPVISSQPISQTVCVGTTAGFCVSATGSALNYQWQFNSTNLSGATGNCYTVTNAMPGQAGNYSVVLSNCCGMVTSSNAVLTVLVGPVITQQPTNVTVIQGSSATFSVTATGTAPLGYQWYFNGTNALVDGTNSVLALTNAIPDQAGIYSVAVSNSCGMVTSSNAVLTVSVPPVITSQPASQTICAGSLATFCVTASGAQPLSYQWRFNETNLVGATNSCCPLTNVQPGQAGNYSAVVSNSCGWGVSSNALLTVLANTAAVGPINFVRNIGQTAVFATTASGSGPFGYVWRKNGGLLSGQTTSALTIANAALSDAGTYTVEVTGACGSVTNSATLTVMGAPTIFIVTPTDSQTFSAPAKIALASVAGDPAGTILYVDYYTNGVFWSRSAANPYQLALTNVLAGSSLPRSIQFKAVAYSSSGLNATSPPVNVIIIPQAPVVAIATPSSNAVFSQGEPIVIQAIAGDVDGRVTNVQFLAGTNILCNDTNAPYVFNWTNAGPGILTNYAIAMDNDGLTATTAVCIVVNDGCPNITGVSNLVLGVSEIVGGSPLTGSVILSNAVPAGSGGQAVNIYSTNPVVIVPPSVFISEGQWSNSFTINTLPVSATNTFTISAQYHGQTAQAASLTVDSSADGSSNVVQYCGPMDVVFVIDTTASMGDALNSVNDALTNTLNSIVVASREDYRLGLVTFDGSTPNCGASDCDAWENGDYVCVRQELSFTNRDQIGDMMGNLTTGFGGELAECSDEALNTVINTISATDPNRNQCGDFTTLFRPAARKIIILVTDAEPGSFQDHYDDTVRSNAFERATEAAAKGIEISTVNVGGRDETKDQIMHYYADTTGGVYTETPDGTQAGMAINSILAQCGSSEGRVIFVRDDQNRQYAPFTVTGPQLSAEASIPAAFDAKGMWGNVLGVRLQRAGTLQATPGSRFDVEIGVGTLTNVAGSFGLLFTNAQKLTGTNHYCVEWELPTAFYKDAEAQLNGACSLLLSNRVSSVCGQTFSATDAPEAAWPWDKNILTLAVVMDRQIPQGHCRDFVLANGDSPVNGTWDIVFRDQIIASSGQPNGWDVEDDYTAYGGLNITVPTNAVVDKTYEVRVQKPSWPAGRSTRIEVLPAGSIVTAPVLLPLRFSTNTLTPSKSILIKVALDYPAPLGGAHVPIYTNGAPCTVVVIPAGQATNTTTISASGTDGRALDILASYNGYRKAKVSVISNSCTTPDAPNPVGDTDTIPGAVLLTWDMVPTATSYNISRGLNGSNYITLFSGLTTNRFVDTSVLPGANYTYWVTAFTNDCSNTGQTSVTTSYNGPAPAPWMLPLGGTFYDGVDVLLTNYIPGAVIYYSTNGTPDTGSDSFVNGGIISLTNSATLKAYTYQCLSDGSDCYETDSRVVSADFTILHPVPIQCGDAITDALGVTNACSSEAGQGWYCRRYSFDGTGDVGKLVTFTVTSTNFYSLVILEDADSNILDWNYNYYDGAGPDDQVQFHVINAGACFVEVTSWFPDQFGDFTLHVDCANETVATLNVFTNAFPAFTTNSARLPIGGLLDLGTINTSTHVTNYVTITNSGNGNLVISNITIAPAALTNGGNGFSIWPTNGITLLPGGITNLAVSLYDTNWSDYDGYFFFESNGAGSSSSSNIFYAYISGQVSQPSGPPWVNIDYPTNGLTIPATNSVITNVDLEIDAEAMDLDGIQKVEFYTNNVLFQTVSNVPYYTVHWVNPPAGQQTITAKAYDNSIPQQTSSTNVVITVGFPTLALTPTNACVGLSSTAFTVTATLLSATYSPLANSSVVFTVTGAHTISYTTNTLANGQASFTYTGVNAGLDTITAAATVSGLAVQSPPVLKNWAKPISCGNIYTGTLANTDGTSIACGCAIPSHFTDFYSLSGASNDVVTFKMTSTNFSTFMFLMNTNCVSLNVTNEMLNLNDVQMRVCLPGNGTYIVEATSADSFKTGNYSLTFTCGMPTTPDIAVSVSGTNLVNYALLDLGTTTNGTPLTRTIGITNVGIAPLNLTGYSWYHGLSNVFSIAPLPVTSLGAGSGTTCTLQFIATNSGQYVDALILTNNAEKNPFVINLNAISIHNGSLPTVSLTAPVNNATYVSPATITIQATATNTSGAAITNVAFIYRTSQGTYLIGNNTARPYSTVWSPGTPGNYDLLAVAYDNQGGIAISLPLTNVQVQPSNQNHSPKANTDTVTVLCNSKNNPLDLLSNDTDPDGDPLTIINYKLSTLPGPHGRVAIGNNGKNICYTPPAGNGSTNLSSILDGFSYEISDGKGGTNWGSVYVVIYATDMPHITITNPAPANASTILYAGTTTNVIVDLWPTSSIVKVQYWVGGDLIGEVTNAPFTVFPWYVRTDPCGCGLVAVAIDKFGQQGVSPAVDYTIQLTNNSPQPYAQIDSPAELSQSPQVAQNGTIERNAVVADGMLVVTGSVYQANDPASPQPAEYKVVIETSDGTLLHDSGWLPAALIQYGPIYTNDLTTLQNDEYNVELFVRNADQVKSAKVPFILNSALKLGVFTFSEQDLVIPAGGVPLSVIRTYNSMNPNLGDFGCSWNYSLADLNVTFHEDRGNVRPDEDNIDDVGPAYNGAYFSIREGGSRDITLTLPNGQRTTFYYYETAGGSLGAFAEPHYYAAPETRAQLDPRDDNGNPISGRLGLIQGYNVWTTPGGSSTYYDNYDFPAYLLTLNDGTQYFIKRGYEGTFESYGSSSYEYFINKVYDDQARVAWIKLPSGEKIVINDATTSLTGSQFSIDYLNVVGTTNRSIYFQRNASGQISAIMDPTSGPNGLPVVQYQYDDYTNLVRVLKLQDRNAQIYATNTYLYENGNFPHYLTKILDARGVPVARNFYDDSGKLLGVIDANGKTNLFVYNISGNSETVFDRMGNPSTYIYDTRGNVTTEIDALNHVTQNTYDGQNNLTSTTDALTNTTSYAYDGNGNRTQVVDPLGHTNLFSYDANNNLLAQTNPVETVTQNQYDSDGNLTNSLQYDSLGNVVQKSSSTYINGRLAQTFDANNSVTTTFTYDANGNLTNTSAANGFSHGFTYDANGSQTGTSYVGKKLDGTSVTIATTNVYDAAGHVTMTIDANGNTNQTFYTPGGKVDHTIDQFGNTNSFLYDARGNLIQSISPFGTNCTVFDDNARSILTTDHNGISGTLTIYDLAGRVTSTIRATNVVVNIVADPNNPGQFISQIGSTGVPYSTNSTAYYDNGWVQSRTGPDGQTTTYAYWADGQTLTVTDPLNHQTSYFYDETGRQTQVWDALNHPTRFGYDALGRQVATVFADGSFVTNEYNIIGQRVGQTDQAGLPTQFGYNVSGLLTNVTDALNQSTRYQYDSMGNEIAQMDALNRTNTFGCDEFGRKARHTMPGGQFESFAYDPANNLIYETNFNGIIITNQYNTLNQLTNRVSANGYRVSYTYTLTGQRATMTDASGVTTCGYDAFDRLVLKTVSWNDGPVISLNYGYDVNGNVINLWSSSPGGVANVYQYDALNRLTNIMAGGAFAAGYTYDAVGNLQTIRYGNGVMNQYQYDELNRLTNLTASSVSGTIARFYYQLGLTGSRTNLSETVNGTGRTYSWQYDPLYRLTNEVISAIGNVGYGYDQVGNRTNRQSTISKLSTASSTYNTNDWLTSDQYDANGNTTNSGAANYQYDALNHLTNVNNGAVLLAYDGDGNRVSKTVGGVTTYYLMDDRNPSGYAQVVEEITASAGATNLTKVYAYGLDLISRQQPGVATNYYGHDGHGSVRYLTGTSGDITDTYTYDAFGNLIASSGSTENNYLYCGEQYDPQLKFYYNRARYLNPDTGRFWTMDTFAGNNEDPLSLHKYLYCQDEPVDGTDPSGRSVYVCTRPLDIKGHENDGNNACHVFLAFDTDGMNNIAAWEDTVRESWDAAKHPNTYGIQYYGDPDNPTFSFHPKSVLNGDESGEYGGPLLTPGSYVADQAGIDQRAVNKTGIGYNKWMVAKGNDIQMLIFEQAVRSRDKNNSGTPDPMPYEFSVFNCGSWVQFILGNNHIAFPDKTINHGVGLLTTGSNGYTAAGYVANAAAKTWRGCGLPQFQIPNLSGFFDGL